MRRSVDGVRLNKRRIIRLGEGGTPSRRPSPGSPLALFLALAFPLLTLCGCGLESLVYYSPPGFVLGGGNIITLSHNTSNIDNFIGYDIYYRAYSTLTDATNARTTIENASNVTTSTPEGVLAQLTGIQGYKKMFLASTPTVAPTPLLSGASTYTIQLTNTENWYYYSDVVPSHIALVRGTGSGESFNATYSIGVSPATTDYTSPDNSSRSSGQSVFIVAFAVAYGYDFTKLLSIYSFPASLNQVLWDKDNGYQLP
jgi:hypothetical protein